MNVQDKERLNRLGGVFADNFEITRYYAWYLEYCPEVINREMIDELTRDGDITKKEAIVALLAEIFGIDVDRGAHDRRILRDYLTPSVRLLDAERYTSDPYYKNIRIESVKDGAWELRLERYPAYRAMIAGDMEIHDGFREVPPLGFFTEDFYFPAVLEDGNEWMTLTPVDLDTSREAIERAHGRVVTFGLGLGYYAYMVSRKSDVESITVIERSPEVIELFKKHVLPQFERADKVRIICADAFEYAEHECPKEGYDVAFVDTWRDASDGAPMYKRMKALEHLSPKTEFLYWIENFLISRIRAEKYEELLTLLDGDSERAPRDFAEFLSRLQNPLSE
ncbi:MAG: hypothetical protein IJW48_04960 [Clostridia bacterium]|nr:hypothetical protein [Clostridia bacterium]